MQQGNSRSSSTYSVSSQQRPGYLEHRNVPSLSSRPDTGTRPTSYTPSYMSNIAPRKPTSSSLHSHEQSMRRPSNPIDVPRTPSRPPPSASELSLTAPDAASSGPAGALLVLAAGPLPPSTLSDLEIILSKQNFTSIVVAASQEHEAALKQLKMDIYALIGKLRREAGVVTITKNKWRQSDVDEIVQDVTKNGSGVQGVLCSPQFSIETKEPNILSLDEGELQACLERSLSFLQAASKATIVRLLSRCKPNAAFINGSLGRSPSGPFFLVAAQEATSPAAQIAKAACDNLILQLAQATSTQRLAVGYTNALLLPEPKKEEKVQASNGPALHSEAYTIAPEDSIFTPGESPTKLWGMWAMHEELAS